MIHFIDNIAISIWAFATWYFAGLGPAFLLLPRTYKREAFLLAPLIGLCLLTLISLLQITVLLTPLLPRANVTILILFSLIICFWIKRADFQITWMSFCRRSIWLWLLPTVLLFVFAWLFHNNGFHLLVGGSDQLQYCQDARQIIEQMHRGLPGDIPIPRQDHFVYEMYTRTLPYIKIYRRGAEVLLATIASTTGLSYEEAFPVTILNALLTLGLVLGFLGRLFLLSLSTRLVLQLTFLSSFYLLLTHIQGSLALIISIAPGLISLAFMVRMISTRSWRWLILSIILVTAYLSIYSEPALINILFPTMLLIIWQFCRSRSSGIASIKYMAIVYLIACILAPFAIYSLVVNTIGNIIPLYNGLVATAAKSSSSISDIRIWALAPVVLGSMSYYDTSAFNNHIAQLIANKPWVGILGFFILCSCALLGYLKTRRQLGYLFAIILIIWIMMSLLFTSQQDFLHFMRSLQYAMPFILFGSVLLTTRPYKKKSAFFWVLVSWIGKIALLSFIILNISTTARTISFITTHHIENDPILLRFDERWDSWHQLQEELHTSALSNTPVLISGFQETIRPAAISIIMRSQPHVLGTSILSFWPIYTSFNSSSWPFSYTDFSSFNTRLTKKEFLDFQQQESKPWPSLEAELIEHSAQAVVPVGNAFPKEWGAIKDIYTPRKKSFPNICDVIYRNEYALILPTEITSTLKKDSKGWFRLVSTSGPIIIHDYPHTTHRLVLNYDGKVGDIKLKVVDQVYKGQQTTRSRQVKIQARIAPDQIKKLSVVVAYPVKLRSMAWEN